MQKKYLLLCGLFIVISYLSCKKSQNVVSQSETLLIPIPNALQLLEGTFELSASTSIDNPDNFPVATSFLKEYLSKSIKSDFSDSNGNTITFVKNDTLKNPEAYYLSITPKTIQIEGKTDAGAFYAVQSLQQLLPPKFESDSFKDTTIEIPCLNITDQPQFAYRGMHLDVARHFYSVDFIKKYIDALAMLKFNRFHWHLTDDQGWRIEIKSKPKLQSVASNRKETLVGHYNDQPQQFDGKPYGGFYTQEDIKEIVAYAQARFITIIPEIEIPGHSQAAIAAYPELGCTGNLVEVATKWGVFENIYCPTEKTFQFLEDVLDEVLELFPSEYIHIGGDEAPKTQWKNAASVKTLMTKEGFKDVAEVQSYFIKRMENYLNNKGRQIIGWDEILEGGLAPNATVMSWRGTEGAVEAAQSGHTVILSPTSHCYFDYYQSENGDEPLAIGGFLPLEKVYSYDPIPEELSPQEAALVLGAQGNVWTEYMSTIQQVEYMVFPRILAMSEVLWSNPKQKNYADFVHRVEHFHQRLDALDINYANHLYETEGKMIQKGALSFYELCTPTQGKTIRYTTDGTQPNQNSAIYKKPIPISKSTQIQAAVFNDSVQLGRPFFQEINYHFGMQGKIHINKEPNYTYSGSGAEGLINGIAGSDKRYGDKEWLGYWGEDFTVTINWEKPPDIQEVSTRFYNANGQWIYAPKTVDIEVIFEDNSSFSKTLNQNPNGSAIVPFTYTLAEKKGIKSVKLHVPNYGIIPEGQQGAGNKAWTFIDEIRIK